MLPVDKNGIPVHEALIWMDRRSDPQCSEIAGLLTSERIFRVTGNSIDPFYTFSELLWFKQNFPNDYEKTKYILQVNGYVNYRFTGEFTLDEVHASITQCYDVRRHEWSEELLSPLGISKDIFPPVFKCHEVIGGVTAAAAQETGIPAGTPVLAGTVDGAAAALEGGVSRDGIAVEMSGTSSVLLVCSEQQNTSKNLTYMFSAIQNQHLLLGCMSTTGGALKWFRNTLYSKKGRSDNAYDQMNSEIVNQAPGPTKLIFLPYLAGERAPIWDSDSKGIFAGITAQTTRAEILRSIMEGAAYALKDNMNEAKRSGASIQKIRAVGGSTNSDIWMKIKASALGLPIEIPVSTLGAPGGLIAISAYTLGEFSSIQEASDSLVTIDRTVEPVSEWTDRYEERFRLFKSLYQHTKEDCYHIGHLE
jgi:xylulokinase